ncbi:MAG: MFS transporter [Actinomycetales bacterium]
MTTPLAPYRRVLGTPGAAVMSASGLLARLPISMVGLGTVLLVEAHTGSYAAGSLVAAVMGVVGAVASPLHARRADRGGQSRVLRPATAVYVVGLLALVATVLTDAPLWAAVAAAAVTGAGTVPIGSMVRSRWTVLLPRGSSLQTAYALESVLDEVVFMLGPVLVTVLAARVSPAGGIVVAVVAAVLGVAALAAQARTEPPPHPHDSAVAKVPLFTSSLVVMILLNAVIGAVFGSIDVTVAAFATEQGRQAMGGVVLAVFAGGSAIGGAVYGSLHWRVSPLRRFLVAMAVLAVGLVPTTLEPSLLPLALNLFVAGLAIAPMLISATTLVEELVPARRRTEAFAWATTGLILGANAGVAAAGPLVDTHGAHRTFLLPALTVLVATVAAAACAPTLRRAILAARARRAE